MASQYTYLTMTTGTRAGSNFMLDPTDFNRLGRGLDCDIVVADPLCSRVHAEVYQESEGWRVRDAGSRNGTFVDDEKVPEARLPPGCRLRIGSTVFSFHCSSEPPTQATGQATGMTQAIICEVPVPTPDTDEFVLAALRHSENQHDLLVLYRLAVRLLASENPDNAIQIGIDLLRERTKAAAVGFLWPCDDGQLKPQRIVPDSGEHDLNLSQTLTDVVLRRRHAVWLAGHLPAGSSSRDHEYSDTISVPLIHGRQMLGALHLCLEQGRFRQIDFDFAVSVAQVLAVGLARSRRQTRLQVDLERLRLGTAALDELTGECEAIQSLREDIVRVARATGCVLVRGERGTETETVARAIHRLSARADRPLLYVNCAAAGGRLIENQLFGQTDGTGAGADVDREGMFLRADAGTLFLDEISELSREGQAKLLRILEGHSFLPASGTSEMAVDVRVIAAASRDLPKLVDEERFREDLYHRLRVFGLSLPPLRDRGPDVELLARYFLDHFRREHGRAELGLSREALQVLGAYPWPGNVRQLRNVIEIAVISANGTEIVAEDLGLRGSSTVQLDSLRIEDWERRLIEEALHRADGNVHEAAQLLGVSRATLYRKIDQYSIQR